MRAVGLPEVGAACLAALELAERVQPVALHALVSDYSNGCNYSQYFRKKNHTVPPCWGLHGGQGPSTIPERAGVAHV